MVFHGIPFLHLFLAVLVLFFGIPARLWRTRKLVLLAASLWFYGSWSPPFLLLLLATVAVDYGAALRMEGATAGGRKAWLTLSLVSNFGSLGFFKYAGFFAGSVSGMVGLPPPVFSFLESVVLPLGISFYTLQSVSYTIDVYRGAEKPYRNFADFLLFVSFFPQLVAGPILRSGEFLPQLAEPKRFDPDRVRRGLAVFVIGLAKKVLLADTLALFVDPVFADPAAHTGLSLLLSLYAFAFQIYFDFSGYSDMAVGLAGILGFDLVENFRHPYAATSIADFWRRWHLSLSRWLRDYLYIPLGGSRGGEWRTYRNLMATMLLGGLWHGAAWTFVIWGGYHGLLLAIQRFFFKDRAVKPGALRVAAVLGTFHLVLVGWFLFRIGNLGAARVFIEGLLHQWEPVTGNELKMIFVVAALYLLHGLSAWKGARAWFVARTPCAQGAAAAAVFALIICMRNAAKEFIYFQF
jgi:D-alanyl-lipoteichoic acid acyltransferase DltB (MBOAT superfamily)